MRITIIALFNKPFVRNVIAVATGTALAQFIAIILSPIITRLYGPESFGVLGIFSGIIHIFAPIFALTYPIAIVLPKGDIEAKGIASLSLLISLISGLLSSIVVFFLKEEILSWLKISSIGNLIYLAPISCVLWTLKDVMNQWFIRCGRFKVIAIITFVNAIIVNFLMIVWGFFSSSGSNLVLLTVLSYGIHGISLAFLLLQGRNEPWCKLSEVHFENSPNLQYLLILAKKYFDFPFYRTPQTLINRISQGIPVLALGAFWGASSAGFYTLGLKVLGIPSLLISKSVGDVLYPRLAQAVENKEEIRKMIVKSILTLVVIGFVPYLVIVFWGPQLFSIFFGKDWFDAGRYAQWLALWQFSSFVSMPSLISLPVLKKQGILLIHEIFITLLRLSSILLGGFYFQNGVITVALFSVIGLIANVLVVFYSLASKMKA